MRKDMFHYLYQAKDPETGQPAYSRDELLAEASLLTIAGSDTTLTSLCGFFFYIQGWQWTVWLGFRARRTNQQVLQLNHYHIG